MKRIGVGIVGVGKIARDQHLPALRSSAAFEFMACAGGATKIEGLPCFATVEDMLDGVPDLDAIAICAPPQVHYDAARLALEWHKHVFLEKPPCSTTGQLDHLLRLARRNRCTLYQTWHARHSATVDAAERWLESRPVGRGHVVWREDVRQWHPGQTWIWKAGGFGVLDAGINAISILTRIIPETLFVESARLLVPSNCETPIAAEIVFRTESGAVIEAEFDFRHRGILDCVIDIETKEGAMRLSGHGAELVINGVPVASATREEEYPSLYRRFAELIERHECEVDNRPFQLVGDIFLVGCRQTIEPFEE